MSGPVVLTLLVRDEVDIVADMLLWHLEQGVDHVIAMDNASTDGTGDILRDFEAMGCLTRLDEPSDAYLQDVWTTRMAHMARDDLGAAWVIPSDADEFWAPARQGPSLRETLDAVPGDVAVLRCARFNLFAPWDEIEALGWRDALIWHDTRPQPVPPARLRDPAPLERPFAMARMPDKALLRPGGLRRIGRGAHPHDIDMDGCGRETAAGIVIHHAPFRARNEVAASVARIGRAIAADDTAGPDVSAKYRRWHAMAARDGIAPVLDEIMPSAAQLEAARLEGRVAARTRLRDGVSPDATRAARLALAGAGPGPDRPWCDPLSAPVPVLLAGGTAAARACVARRLREIGVRPVNDGVDWPARIDDLARAMADAPPAETLAELRAAQSMHVGRWNGLLLDTPEASRLWPLWQALSDTGHVAPALVLLADRDGAETARALEADSRGHPRLVAPSHTVANAPPKALRDALSGLGLSVPISVALASEPLGTEPVPSDPDLLRAGWAAP